MIFTTPPLILLYIYIEGIDTITCIYVKECIDRNSEACAETLYRATRPAFLCIFSEAGVIEDTIQVQSFGVLRVNCVFQFIRLYVITVHYMIPPCRKQCNSHQQKDRY